MSERILKALMQLFAIIAPPESNVEERRSVVESFLKQLLNQELVREYLKVYDEYYNIYQKKQNEETTKRKKSIALSSVKVLKICTAINEELTQKQKIIVLVRLLEFIKTDLKDIGDQELEFVETVADSFHIAHDEFQLIKSFVVNSFNEIPLNAKVLLIDGKGEDVSGIKHICSLGLQGEIKVMQLAVGDIYLLRYFGGNELYLTGQLVKQEKIYILTTGSSIRNAKIKPIYYSDIISTFNIDRIKVKTVYEVKYVDYKFKGGKYGLHNINFVEESGKLVGIMGASGSGKSTLLSVLNGTYKPSSGYVHINGIDIHNQKDQVEGLIGYVSQDDLLIEDLTVFQNLYYNAKLCFDNYNENQIVRAVLKTLENLGLYEIKDMIVGSPLNKKISGGQRKRLNIALELIREPSILFLDEPTSGLSSRDSENILDLLKELALKGKLVFVVIHQPSSDIFKMFDKLIILDTGGYMIYCGDPVDSIIYFKSRIHQADWNDSECRVCGNVNPEQVFNIIESPVLDEYGNITHTRKISPKEWASFYTEYSKKESYKEFETPNLIPEITFKIPNWFKQFKVFVIRDVLSKLANTQYLVINLLEAPLLAFLLSYIIRYYDVDVSNEYGYTLSDNSNLPVYIFMSVIVAIFVGLTVSAEEIIKDRKILKRESFLNLSRASYLMSKVVILLVLSAFQAITFVLIGNFIMDIKGMYFEYWLVLFSAFSFSNMLGLNISDSFKTAVTIYILIPFLVIPQMILSGIIVKYDKLNPDISSPSDIPFYGEIITARWAYEALAVYQFMENDYQKQFYVFDKIMSEANYRKDYWIPELRNKVTSCKRNLSNPQKKEQVSNDLELLRNEIGKELVNNNKIPFNSLNSLYAEKVTAGTLAEVEEYLEQLNRYLIKKYNKANSEKDKMLGDLQKTDEDKKALILLKKNYYNENLSELVTNSNSLDRIVEFDNQLFQKIDPIFHDPPANSFVKAHFYAPRKMLFGSFVSTFWVNIIVMWIMTIIMYITLYYKALKNLLDFFERISSRFSKDS
jgi:ABC transport system ATP-binding/permease protein